MQIPGGPCSASILESELLPRRPYFRMFDGSCDTTRTISSITSRSKPMPAVTRRTAALTTWTPESSSIRHVTSSRGVISAGSLVLIPAQEALDVALKRGAHGAVGADAA